MIKVLLYKRLDGGISCIVPGLNDDKIEILLQSLMDSGLTRDEAEAAYTLNIKERFEDVKEQTSKWAGAIFVKEEDPANLPSEEFRNQWRESAGNIQVDPTLETEERWKRIRADRDERLDDSDGLMARANELNQNVQEWKDYRQDLRDVPAQADPKNITWPTEPI